MLSHRVMLAKETLLLHWVKGRGFDYSHMFED